MADKTETKEKKQAKLVKVPTEYGLAFELEDETVVSHDEILVKIYNRLLQIEKAVA